MSRILLFSLVLVIGTFISSVSQVLLKKSALKEYKNKLAEYLNPEVIIAYGMFFASTIMSVIAYKGIPLSLGPVLEATSYIDITVFGITIFHEKMSRMKYLALFLILVGIVVFAFSS